MKWVTFDISLRYFFRSSFCPFGDFFVPFNRLQIKHDDGNVVGFIASPDKDIGNIMDLFL